MTNLIAPLAPVGAVDAAAAASVPLADPARATRFGDMVLSGLSTTGAHSAAAADALARFTAGSPVAPHELMIAMEQARLSLQLTVEIRNRLVDAYQELTRLQI